MQLTAAQIAMFQETVWDYYRTAGRAMPWRKHPEPYAVLVSELMLQQTQVSRVLPKFEAFMRRFPTLAALAAAPLGEVLQAWSGLGYNRRAKFLHQAAQQIVAAHHGEVPRATGELTALPGIGKNTAGAVLAYAFNQPVVFIETNIRSVYIHHFFSDEQDVEDRALVQLIEQTLDHEHPREWYWALMDYGTHLKQTRGNNIAQSRHYTKQSRFAGSRRQLRGQILKALVNGPVEREVLDEALQDQRFSVVVAELEQEGFLEQQGSVLKLTGMAELS